MARSAQRDPGSGRSRGRLPRRRPEPCRRDRGRPPGLRRPRGAGACGRGDGRPRPAHHDAERPRRDGPAGRRSRPGPAPGGPHRPVPERPARRQRRRLPRPSRSGRGPAPAPDGDRACGRRRGDHPRPRRGRHRRRRFDRLRAGAPGVRDRSPAARPRRSRGEPALPHPARARDAARAGTRFRRGAHPSRERREPRGDGAPHRRGGARRDLPRRRLQARADDGGAPVRRRPRQRGRDARPARCCGGGRRAALRARVHRQGGPAVERHGREQAGRRDARRRRGSPDRPAIRLGPLRERPRLERERRADLPGAARGRASRSRSPTPR